MIVPANNSLVRNVQNSSTRFKEKDPLDSGAYDDDRVFACDHEGCIRSFRTRSSLRDHQKVHSDDRYGTYHFKYQRIDSNKILFNFTDRTYAIIVVVLLSPVAIEVSMNEVHIQHSFKNERLREKLESSKTVVQQMRKLLVKNLN